MNVLLLVCCAKPDKHIMRQTTVAKIVIIGAVIWAASHFVTLNQLTEAARRLF